VEGDHQFKGVPHEYVILTVFDMGTGNLLKEQGFGYAPVFRCLAYNPKRQTKCELLINPTELFESISGERNLLTRSRRRELVSIILDMMRLKRSVRADDVLVFAWREILQERREQEEELEEKEAQLQRDQQINNDVIDIYKLTDPRVIKWSTILTRAMHLTGESPNSVVVTLNVVWLLPQGRTPQMWFTAFFPHLTLTRTMAASRLFATIVAKSCADLNTVQELADFVKESLATISTGGDDDDITGDIDIDDDDDDDDDDGADDNDAATEQRLQRAKVAERLQDVRDCLAVVCEATMQIHDAKVQGSDMEDRSVTLDESVLPDEAVARLRKRRQDENEAAKHAASTAERDVAPVAPAQTILGSKIFRGPCVFRSAAMLSRRQVVVTMHVLLRIRAQKQQQGSGSDGRKKSVAPEKAGMMVQVYCPSLSQHATCCVSVKHLGGLPSAVTAEQLVKKLEVHSEAVDNHMTVCVKGVENPGQGIELVVEKVGGSGSPTNVKDMSLVYTPADSIEVDDDDSGGGGSSVDVVAAGADVGDGADNAESGRLAEAKLDDAPSSVSEHKAEDQP
jgi:hypothetical protein